MFGFRDSAVGLDVDIERRECYNRGNLSEVAGEGAGWRAVGVAALAYDVLLCGEHHHF